MLSLFSFARAEDYSGQVVKSVEIEPACVPEDAKELRQLIRKHILIQSGDLFSIEAVRRSIREIYAQKRFVQITVEAEPVDGGVRLSFCPEQIKTISKIQIRGNTGISSDRIKTVLDLKVGDRVPPNGMNTLKQRVLKLYREQGYHQVTLTIETQQGTGVQSAVILTLDIQEGSPSRIGTPTFKGQSAVDEDTLRKVSTLQSGTRFTLERLDRGIEKITRYYAEQGYLDASVTSRDMKYHYDTGEVNLTLTLDEGQPTDLRFEGNTAIKTGKLRETLNLFTPQGIPENLLKESAVKIADLYRAKGYHFVKVTFEQTREDEAHVIVFHIEEGSRVEVNTITIEGNQAFADDAIREQMFTTSSGFFSKGWYQETVFKEDLQAIKAFYQQHGYLEADVISTTRDFSPDRSAVSIRLVIEEGVQTRIHGIEIAGVETPEAEQAVRERLKIEQGMPLNIDLVTQSGTAIQNMYANQGFIQAEVDVSTQFSPDKRRADIRLTVKRGTRFYIGRITIQGVFRTKEQFITRELQVKEGDVYNPAKVRETVQRLFQLGLYESVAFRRLDSKSTEPVQDMILLVKETSAKTVEFGGGYSTEANVNAFVEYSDKNVLNYGGRGTARAEVSLERPKLTLQYQHPHFLTPDTSVVVSVYDDFQRDNKSFEIERRGGRLAVQHQFDPTLSASVGYFFEYEDPSNVKEDATLSSLDTAVINVSGLDAGVTWDFRDDVINPRKGGYTRLYLRTAQDALGAETSYWEVNAQAQGYLRLFDDVVLACSLKGNHIESSGFSDDIPIYDRYFMGGDHSVRGFTQHSIGPSGAEGSMIGGNRLVGVNAEIRFPIYTVLGGVIFVDGGANWLSDRGFETALFRESIGAGLRVSTPVGPLRLDYGWKLDRQSGESAGKYYLTIGAAF